MKKIITVTIMALFLFSVNANAQSVKEMWAAKKTELKEKAKKKLEDKTSQGIDSAMNKPERIIEKKIKKKDNKTKIKIETEGGDENSGNSGTEKNSNTNNGGSDNSMTGEGVQTVIQTNILCDAGKSKVEKALKKQDGVFEVKVNIKNGELAIRYSSDGTSYSELLKLINQQGFEADGGKPAAGAPANPCKK